jgi:hypothetical protein
MAGVTCMLRHSVVPKHPGLRARETYMPDSS